MTDAAQEPSNNPTTPETTVPTTETPVSEAPNAVGAPPDASAPTLGEAPPDAGTHETKTYADGSSATGVDLPDVSPLDNASPAVSAVATPNGTASAAGDQSAPAEMPSAPVVVEPFVTADKPAQPLHAQIAPHLEAIYATVKGAEASTVKPGVFAEVKAHLAAFDAKIRNGISVADHEVVSVLEKLRAVL